MVSWTVAVAVSICWLRYAEEKSIGMLDPDTSVSSPYNTPISDVGRSAIVPASRSRISSKAARFRSANSVWVTASRRSNRRSRNVRTSSRAVSSDSVSGAASKV
ncbi:hypothetical protein [Halobellus ruber]|uniref:Uncharacterized protein n=1 Tax=Halobellus ruber TaxID=2761102 RepID=A0A7J9SHT8_9EURY|nr:hypothetical protein [Halobellus ruber]